MKNRIERNVKEQVKTRCKVAGAFYVMPVSMGLGARGTPDFLICHRGRFLAVETKAPGGKPTPHQTLALARCRQAGGVAMVVDGTDFSMLDEFLAVVGERIGKVLGQ